jgi:DNA-directed RNA polymerase specialized sigma24 family protein
MAPQAIPPPPPHTEGLRLHQALSSPDATASWDFARAYLPHLTAWLQVRSRPDSADLCEEAAIETVYGLLNNPGQYNPEKGMNLLNYLRLAARRDLFNLLRSEARHRHEPLDENGVELRPVSGKRGRMDDSPLQILCDRVDEQERQSFLADLRGSLNDEERTVLDLLLSGERQTRGFAEGLGMSSTPVDEQELQVKRIKDRIKARIKRMRDRP